MGKALKLVNKLNRRRKYFKSRVRGFDRYDKIDQAEERMAKSEKAYSALLRPQRRGDRNFGTDFISYEPKISKKEKISSVARVVYGPGNAIELTMASGLIADMHLALGDVVRFLNGALKGQYLKVIAIPDATHVLLEDVASYSGPESDIIARFQLSDVKGSYY